MISVLISKIIALKKYVIPVLFFMIYYTGFSQQTEYSIVNVEHIGGFTDGYIIDGNYAYLLQGSYLNILDISKSDFPQVASMSLHARGVDLSKSGNYLYCYEESDSGFQVVDVSNPLVPVSRVLLDVSGIGASGVNAHESNGLSLAGNYAYVATVKEGLNIVNISNPVHPVKSGKMEGFHISDQVIANGHLYTISTQDAKFRIFDLSDSLHPILQGQVSVPHVVKLVVDGTYAYISCSHGSGLNDNGLRIIDVSDATKPLEAGYFRTTNRTYSTVLHDDYAYLGTEAGMIIVDISTKNAPLEKGRYAIPHTAWSQVVSFRYAPDVVYCVVNGKDISLMSIDVSDPAHPAMTVSHASPDIVTSICMGESQFYLTSYHDLYVYDVGNSLPVLRKTYEAYHSGTYMQHLGSMLFVTGEDGSKLQIINTADPENLVLLGEYKKPSGWFGHFATVNNAACMQTDDNHLQIIDISDPSSPQLKGEVYLRGEALDILARDTIVYSSYRKSTSEKGFEIYSIASKSNPRLIIRQSTKGTPNTLCINGDTLFVGGNVTESQFFLQSFLVSNPNLPKLLAETTGNGKLRDVEVRENTIFATVFERGVLRFKLNSKNKTIQQVAEDHSPGGLQLAIAPPDNSGYSLIFTAVAGACGSSTKSGVVSSNKLSILKINNIRQTESQSVIGDYGLVVKKTKVKKKAGRPVMSLSKHNIEYEPVCPACDTAEKTIAQLSIGVDETDSWQVQAIKFKIRGSGKVYPYVKQAILYVNNKFADSCSFAGQKSEFSLRIHRLLPPGSKINLKLTYKFCFPETREPEQFGEYGVETKATWVSSQPEHFSVYEKLPAGGLTCGNLLVAAVQNLQSHKYFAKIQDAIDDNATKDGDMIVVCSGTYHENVDVNKSVDLTSWRGSAYTNIIPVDNSNATITISVDHVKLHGFTFSDASSEYNSAVSVINTRGGRYVDQCEIYANNFTRNYYGIRMSSVRNSRVRINTFIKNQSGVILEGASSQDTIGGKLSKDVNYFLLNGENGVQLIGKRVSQNCVAGNFVGVDQNMTKRGNSGTGIRITLGANHNTIGGPVADYGNVIGGNEGSGILIDGNGSDFNNIRGNFIGTSKDLKVLIPNFTYGIEIKDGACENMVGDSLSTDFKNYIHHNKKGGILIHGNTTDNNRIEHNHFTLNTHFGIKINDTAANGIIYANELIATNGDGVHIEKANHNLIVQNEFKENTDAKNDWDGFYGGHCMVLIQSNDNTIHHNIFRDDRGTGLIARGVSNSRIFLNTFKKLDGDGISIEDAIYTGENVKIAKGSTENWGNNEIYQNTITGEKVRLGIVLADGKIPNRIENNKIVDAECAILISETDSARILSNEIYSQKHHPTKEITGIALSVRCAHNIIAKNNIHDLNELDDTGISLSGDCHKNRITENILRKDDIAIKVTSRSSENIIDKNDIYNTLNIGVYVHRSEKMAVKNNTFTKCRIRPIVFFKSPESHIEDNQIDSTYAEAASGFAAISLISSRHSTVLRNHIHNIKYAFWYDKKNKEVYEQYGEGILVRWSDGSLISRNHIENNNNSGIRISVTKGCTVSQNVIENNEKEGVILDLCERCTITGNFIKRNVQNGILIHEISKNNLVEDNLIVYNNQHDDAFAGIAIIGWDYAPGNVQGNVIRRNNIGYNCTGIVERYTSNNVIANNTIYSSRCTETGIHLCGSNPVINGNSITGNQGVAIHCENSAFPVISKNVISQNTGDGIKTESNSNPIVFLNNISENGGYGLNNADTAIAVYASYNWWGSTDGPGDGVNGSADFSDWESSPVSLEINFPMDTIYVESGTRDSLACYLQNWENRNDLVRIDLSDSLNWLQDGHSNFTMRLQDSLGTDTLFFLDIPASVSPGSINKIKVIAHSVMKSTTQTSDSLIVMIYKSGLQNILVSPDSCVVKQGDSVRFTARGLDQRGKAFVFTPVWSVSSGIIDSTGFFHADSTEHEVLVTVKDTHSTITGISRIYVTGDKPVLTRIKVKPDSVFLNQGGVNQFTAFGYDQFNMKKKFSPQWSVSGGSIDMNGYFRAPEKAGEYMVFVEDTMSHVSAQARVVVTSVTAVKGNKSKDKISFLSQNFPNPFNKQTSISFHIVRSCPVSLVVYDTRGRKIAVLASGIYKAGRYKVTFQGDGYPAGLYFYEIRTGNIRQMRKMMIRH